jgi:hypothetical protein
MRPQPRSRIRGAWLARQARTAQHIRLEEAHPIRILDREERLRLEGAEIVNEDVEFRCSRDESRCSFGAGRVGGDAIDRGVRERVAHPLDGAIDRRRTASIEDNRSPRFRKPLGDRETDSRRRCRDERSPPVCKSIFMTRSKVRLRIWVSQLRLPERRPR